MLRVHVARLPSALLRGRAYYFLTMLVGLPFIDLDITLITSPLVNFELFFNKGIIQFLPNDAVMCN